ncbi:MAG: hypothetical protein ACOYNI_04485 [Acidimicrobiia bacterium]
MGKKKQKKTDLRPDRIAGPRREWVDFEDHEHDDCTWRVDVTFLASGWTCIYGNGCQGNRDTKTPELMEGCCSHGAYLTDKADLDHVVEAAKHLNADEWQFKKIGDVQGIAEKIGKNQWRTRLVDDACVFLNRPEFDGPVGCALHHYADRTGIHFAEVKPEVCWQLPLRLVNQEQENGDMVWYLTEYDRAAWDEGGAEFAWWCTEAPEAFVGHDPVYITMEAELRKMLGDLVYEDVRKYLDERRGGSLPKPHDTEVPVTLDSKP